jgi:adenylylsulfate kinase
MHCESPAKRTSFQPYRVPMIWLTGLSGAGRTTIGRLVHLDLGSWGYDSEFLDADVLRSTLTRDLGFTKEDRVENIRRIGAVANPLTLRGIIVVAAAITPYLSMREELRQKTATFVEVYSDTPLEVCERLDPKGLCRRVRAGEIGNFTGIDSPYEIPLQLEVHCYSARKSVNESV